jgi:hypothetical protein
MKSYLEVLIVCLAPAAGAISYETKAFTLGDPDEHPPYIGHNVTKVDQLWEDLYGCGL